MDAQALNTAQKHADRRLTPAFHGVVFAKGDLMRQ